MFEIMYYWVEYRERIRQQGFNFSPEVKCRMEIPAEDKYYLHISTTGKMNIMHNGNISGRRIYVRSCHAAVIIISR